MKKIWYVLCIPIILSSLAKAQTVSSVSLLNADTGAEIQKLGGDSTLNLAYLPSRLAVRANASNVGSIKFGLNAQSNFSIESKAPYCMSGDSNGKCHAQSFALGLQKIVVTPYSKPKASGSAGSSITANLNVINKKVAQILSVSLFDSKTGAVINPALSSGASLNIENLDSKCLNLRANLDSGLLGSVVFDYGTPAFAVENTAPYDLMGDAGSRGCLGAGSHSVKIIPFSERNGTGISDSSQTFTFSLQNNSVAAITSFSLLDMKTNQVIFSNVENSSSLTVADLANRCLSIRANVGPGLIGSVNFGLGTNLNFANENAAPYDLMGDNGSRGCLQAGSHKVSATPYSESNRQGIMGSLYSRSFTIANSIITPVTRNNIILEQHFEETLEEAIRVATNPEWDFYGANHRVSRAKDKPYAFNVPTDIVREGKRAGRFEMRSTDKAEGIVRSEIIGNKSETDRHRWYGYSLYLPSEHWATDSNWDIISQWWSAPDPGEGARNPPIDLWVSGGRMKIKIIWASALIHDSTSIDGSKTFDLGPVEKDKWLDFVFHIKFSYESDGILEVWKNGTKVVDHRGPNSYNDAQVPWFKIGLYKRGFGVPGRVIYGDSIRVGNGNATYKDVAP